MTGFERYANLSGNRKKNITVTSKFEKVTSQLVPKSTGALVNSYLFLVNSCLSQLVPKSTRT